MRVTKDIFAAMDEETQALFTFDEEHNCYVGKAVTWPKVEDKKNSKQYAAKVAVGFNVNTGKIDFRNHRQEPKPYVQPVKNTRNWGF